MATVKRRTEIRKLENEAQKLVTFSKRHQGLCRKAQEYANITSSHVAVLVFSPTGKPFVRGSPSFEAVVESYLNVGRRESDTWEAYVGLQEKAAVAETVEELLAVKMMLEEIREMVLKSVMPGKTRVDVESHVMKSDLLLSEQ
ncbi:hypothetical protein Patl1_11841 [Pistacia atlantica]|uniref:Uncharacterized protein n=1 Tax=Pistacia atlantica TaxID=434234 RepID=A0ACC1A4H0_9ROSI|nr:hypothetical protein Patl1_11841 [Pistacia atlantica]